MSASNTTKIKITISGTEFQAELNGSRTAQAIAKALPISARGNFWGEEIYLPIPVKGVLENPQEVVERGALAYWPPGSAFCIFWGPTPASEGSECRPASPVTVVGRIHGNLGLLKSIRKADVKIERAE